MCLGKGFHPQLEVLILEPNWLSARGMNSLGFSAMVSTGSSCSKSSFLYQRKKFIELKFDLLRDSRGKDGHFAM